MLNFHTIFAKLTDCFHTRCPHDHDTRNAGAESNVKCKCSSCVRVVSAARDPGWPRLAPLRAGSITHKYGENYPGLGLVGASGKSWAREQWRRSDGPRQKYPQQIYCKPRNTQRSIIVKSRNKTKKSKNLVIRETKVQTTSHKLMPGTNTKQNSLQYPISEGEKSDSDEAT